MGLSWLFIVLTSSPIVPDLRIETTSALQKNLVNTLFLNIIERSEESYQDIILYMGCTILCFLTFSSTMPFLFEINSEFIPKASNPVITKLKQLFVLISYFVFTYLATNALRRSPYRRLPL